MKLFYFATKVLYKLIILKFLMSANNFYILEEYSTHLSYIQWIFISEISVVLILFPSITYV